MFVINKDATQELFINLSGEVFFDNYLFVVNSGLAEEKKFFAPESSTEKTRYHKFTIEENVVEDLLEGIVSFPTAGDFSVELHNVEFKVFDIPVFSQAVWRGLFRVKRNKIEDKANEPIIETVQHDPR